MIGAKKYVQEEALSLPSPNNKEGKVIYISDIQSGIAKDDSISGERGKYKEKGTLLRISKKTDDRFEGRGSNQRGNKRREQNKDGQNLNRKRGEVTWK